jgi:HTH-type transcriptional repressor of NAD biosynthesis genes
VNLKKIVLFGSESTGKTTLAQQLATHFQTEWVPEYAREYLETEQERLHVYYSDVMPIALGQVCLEDQMALKARQFLFCDTNLLQTKVYSQVYFGKYPQELLSLIAARNYDLYLLTGIDVPWTPDPLRDRPHMRKEMHILFRKELISQGSPFEELQGSRSERLKTAIRLIEERF